MAEDVHRPLAVYRFSLTPADRLAFAMLRRELTGWEKFRLILIVGISGMMAGILPEDMRPVAWWAAVAVILSAGAAAAILWSNLEIRRKAATLDVPKGEILVEEWGDHLVVRSQAGARHLSYEMIGNIITTDEHVFILLHGAPVIVPLRAFEDRQAMVAFAEAVDKRSQEAVP